MDNSENDEQKILYRLIIQEKFELIFDKEFEYNIIIIIESQIMDYLFIKNNEFIYHYIELYYNRYIKIFSTFLLYK